MREPLIHIGYHKTGSTYLQQKIFCDEQLGFLQAESRLTIEKAFVAQNPFTFAAEQAVSTFLPLLDEAQRRGLVPVLSHERLSGDVEQGGIDARMIADRLHETFPSARILIVIREQRDMLMSTQRSQMRFSSRSLEERWRERTVRERRQAGPTLELFEYHHLIRYYQRLFGDDRVLVLAYEELRDDPLGFVSKVAKFVELPSPADVPVGRVNPGLPAGLVVLTRPLNVVYRVLGLSTRFEGPIEEREAMRLQLRTLRKIARLVPRSLSRRVEARWREAIERITKDRFAESNRLTAELTGLDLASFGYVVQRQGD